MAQDEKPIEPIEPIEVEAKLENKSESKKTDARKPSMLGLLASFFGHAGRAAEAGGKAEIGAAVSGFGEGLTDPEGKLEAAKPHLEKMGETAKAIGREMKDEVDRSEATQIAMRRWGPWGGGT